MQMVFDFPVHPRYSFDNFVVCGGNQLAYQFAEMLAQNETQQLLYLYGPSGSGKTHLLAALGSRLIAGLDDGSIPLSTRIPYISCSEIDQLYGGEYPPEQTSRLAECFKNAPVLLIDDLHLIPDNVNIRIELWQIFNDYFNSGRKIVVTGLHHPRELPTLDDHLISRLLWGLVARMDVSDDDSRRLIMKKLAEDRQIYLPADAIDYLLRHTSRDIPSLMEALEDLRHFALATGRKISLRLAKDIWERKAEA